MGASGRSALFSFIGNHRLSVIVPVFNERKNIRGNLDLLISEVEPYFSDYEVLVVSDGSTDGTNEELARFSHPKVRVLNLPKNRGKGSAVREGFKQASGDSLLFIDGGMELHPKEIRVFFGLMALYEADLVVGSKRHPQSKVDYPWFRKVLSRIYQGLIRRLFGLDVTDTQVGVKLFRREVIDAILPELEIDRYGFDLEILALARQKGFTQMLEAPIRLDYFGKVHRSRISEIFHVLKVGSFVLRDTGSLYLKLRNRRSTPVSAQDRGCSA